MCIEDKEEQKKVVEAIRLGRLQEVAERVQADPGIVHHTSRVREQGLAVAGERVAASTSINWVGVARGGGDG